MNNKKTCNALAPFGTSVFTMMSKLANKENAVNLSQGFPDFDGPLEIKKAAADAIMNGSNQYTPTEGIKALRQAIARKASRFYGADVDWETEVTVTSGATEALSAAFLGILNPEDEVVLFEPAYDLYHPMIKLAGAKAVFVSLDAPDFKLTKEALQKAFNNKTRAVVINNPQNPCGKVFTRTELSMIADLCEQYDVTAISDEVYEHIVFSPATHISLLEIPQLRWRRIVISSTAKTFSMTGWKIGYAVACPELTNAVRMSHQFLTYCIPGAFQTAMASAMDMENSYYGELVKDYTLKKDKIVSFLEDKGFSVLHPDGAYYVLLNIDKFGFEDDLKFCDFFTREVKVALIPASFFWNERSLGKNLVRLCFAKKMETLEKAMSLIETSKIKF